MANGQGISRNPATAFSRSFSRALPFGAGVAFQAQEQQRAEEQQKLAAQMGKIGIAFKVLENKNVPTSAKLETFNKTIVPIWNEINGGQPDRALGTIDEWNDRLTEVGKELRKLWSDPEIGLEQKLDMTAAYQVQLGNDVDLAPYFERGKEKQKQKTAAETLAYKQILQKKASGAALTKEDITEAARIQATNPEAALEGGKLFASEAKEARPLTAYTNEQGIRIQPVMAGGEIVQLPLGRTRDEFKVSREVWEASIRAAGLAGIPKEKWTKAQTQDVLDIYSKTNPATAFMRERFNQLGGSTTPTRPTPEEEDLGKAYLGR